MVLSLSSRLYCASAHNWFQSKRRDWLNLLCCYAGSSWRERCISQEMICVEYKAGPMFTTAVNIGPSCISWRQTSGQMKPKYQSVNVVFIGWKKGVKRCKHLFLLVQTFKLCHKLKVDTYLFELGAISFVLITACWGWRGGEDLFIEKRKEVSTNWLTFLNNPI